MEGSMKTKIIKDLAYGFIEIDENIEKVIDHRSFQRLKNISQLTAHHLFPSANHTRFEHSLGVMHLSMKFLNVLSEKIKELGKGTELFIDRLHLQYASLLHDVGHGPMSHVGESFYDRKEIISKIKLLLDSDDESCYSKGSLHELMSCYVIAKNFKETLNQIFTDSTIGFDIQYIFRIITGSKYNSSDKWNQDLIIEILNSNSIDVDKIDYLIRDNLMTGGVAPNINIERLLYSITIDSMKKIAYSPVGISSVVSIIDSRDFLYLWLYNHHIVVYTDFLYKTAINHLSSKDNDKSKNKILLSNYFSCEAISELYVTDDDIRVILNKEYSDTNSNYSKKILSQLLERKFLKPIWKTIFEFNTFMYNKAYFDDRQRKKILQLIQAEKLSDIASDLIKECGLEPGDLFVIERSNKFYAMSDKTEFYINTEKEGDIELSQIMPERRFDENYSNVAFYVFTIPKKIDEAKQKLVQILKRNI